MQVIGLCRFSYPAIGGFQVEHADPAARSAYLYAPARMEERFRTFSKETIDAACSTAINLMEEKVGPSNSSDESARKLWEKAKDGMKEKMYAKAGLEL